MPIENFGFRESLPFDSTLLDELMDREGIDILLVTSKHNIQYLLGGYRFFFFDYSDAIGVSRYLPVLIYPKGHPENAFYIGNAMEISEVENGRFWMSKTDTTVWGSVQAMKIAVAYLNALNASVRIGVEFPFMPADAIDVLRTELSTSQIVDGHFPLERLRARKTTGELTLIKEASDRVVASMIATFAALQPGMTKHDVVKTLRHNETERDLVFEYCLMTAGSGLNRAPSDQVLCEGDILSLDSGGRYQGYIGDLCRMGIVGTPDAELVDLLAEVDTIQQAARKTVRAGVRGRDIFAAADPIVEASAYKGVLHFVAHGMGIIGHEAPRLSGRGPVTYEGYDMDRPLEAGMVLSIETTMLHPRRGFIKLEDALAVTEDGFIAFGDDGRGWNSFNNDVII